MVLLLFLYQKKIYILEKLENKVCQQYATLAFGENVILLDTGHIKLMTSHYPIDKLRKIRGLENATYIDPISAGNGNSIRYLAASKRDNKMRVDGNRKFNSVQVKNLDSLLVTQKQ